MLHFASVNTLSQESLCDSSWNRKKWRSGLWLCVCVLVMLVYGALGRQWEAGSSATNQPVHQNTTCIPELCPLLLTRGIWEAFCFKNLMIVNKTPMQAGHQPSFLNMLVVSQPTKRSLFHACQNTICNIFLGKMFSSISWCVAKSNHQKLPWHKQCWG